jgi:Ca2+-transporting ATPase
LTFTTHGELPHLKRTDQPLYINDAPWPTAPPTTVSGRRARRRALREDFTDGRGRESAQALSTDTARTPAGIIWQQLSAPLMLVLMSVAAISLLYSDWRNVSAILLIIIINSGLGFIEETRADRTITRLRRIAVPSVRVRDRDGSEHLIRAHEVKPGDVILLEAGSLIPADARLIESSNLRIQEITPEGETVRINKRNDQGGSHSPIDNMLWRGSTVIHGTGAAVVLAANAQADTPVQTPVASKIRAELTPLQKRVALVCDVLLAAIMVDVALVVTAGAVYGKTTEEMIAAAVVVVVAACPIGLPGVMTIALAQGAQTMLENNILVRRLSSVENVASVNVICADKAGTLVEEHQTVRVVSIAGYNTELVGQSALDQHDTTARNHRRQRTHPATKILLALAAMCREDRCVPGGKAESNGKKAPQAVDEAFVRAATEHDIPEASLDEAYPVVAEAPFSAARKRVSTVHQLRCDCQNVPLAWLFRGDSSPFFLVTKGSFDSVLSVCNRVWRGDQIVPLTGELRRELGDKQAGLVEEGLYVLGIACRPLEKAPDGAVEPLETGLVFIGMAGMNHPPREGVRLAIWSCLSAGIRPVMLSGDDGPTAGRIARALHISFNNKVLTGAELAQIPDEDLPSVLQDVSAFSRITPEQRLALVTAFQKSGANVSITGHHVDDAPALQKADIGAAMGVSGTDIAQDSADIVIMDDNFSTLVRAMEIGRTVCRNARRYIGYIIASTVGQVACILLTQAFGMPVPLTVLQLLWINLITGGIPGLALGLEPADKNVMRSGPRPQNEGPFSQGLGYQMVVMGFLVGILAMCVGVWGYQTQGGHAGPWSAMIFTALTSAEMSYALNARSETQSLFRIGLATNRPLLTAAMTIFVMHMAILYLPPLQSIFHTHALTGIQLLVSLGAGSIVFWAVEFEKWTRRRVDLIRETGTL